MFFVPKQDRNFTISNSDFKFFTIENATSATVPTALGPKSYTHLDGQIGNSPVRLWTPDGVNEETIFYPYLQASLGLWKGTELEAKYSTKVDLKKGNYQVYGFGVKHNLSQYFKSLQSKKINIAALASYSNENISFDFLDVQTDYGNLGLNQITGLVNTYQFQISASKEWKRFEFLISAITNESSFKYEMTGPKGQIESIVPFQDIVNAKLKEIYKSKMNTMGEVSCRYQISKIFVQSTFAFGKFANGNVSVQYEF